MMKGRSPSRVLRAGSHLFFMKAPVTTEKDRPVSLLKLKEAARKLLPVDSLTRRVITAEPDVLPMGEAISKFKVFDSLLLEELGTVRRPR